MQTSSSGNAIPTMAEVFKLAWPLCLKAIMLHGIIVIDAWLVAPLGEEALAAMGLAGSVAGLLLGFVFAFSTASQIRVAHAFGSGEAVALKTAFYAGLLSNLVVAGIGVLILIVAGGTLIAHFAHTPWIEEQAMRYLGVFLFVVLAEAVGGALSSHFNGCGNSRAPFYSYLISLPVNVSVSVVLIDGALGFPELGVVGAAVGLPWPRSCAPRSSAGRSTAPSAAMPASSDGGTGHSRGRPAPIWFSPCPSPRHS